MILNTQIWQNTVDAAKTAASNSPAWTRAIERAVIEIEKSHYWSFADGVLTTQSTTSKKLYKIDDNHTCEACAHGHKACKHRAARKLMQRHSERLAAVPKADRFTEREQAPLVKRAGNAVMLDGFAI